MSTPNAVIAAICQSASPRKGFDVVFSQHHGWGVVTGAAAPGSVMYCIAR
jgi:hypothetical protein